jgi:hypothetical protein
LLFPYAPLRLGGKLILNRQKVSRQAANKEHQKTNLTEKLTNLTT